MNKKNSILKTVQLLFLSIICLYSLITYSQTIKPQEVIFYDKPLYTFRGKTPHISMPISAEYTISASAWNHPRIPMNDLPAEITNNMSIDDIRASYDSNMSKFVKYTNDNEANSSSNKNINNLGYFNHLLCYAYDSSKQYFYPTQQISKDKTCPSGQFSGSYMNWTSMTILDLFRYALTGGSRDIDTTFVGKNPGITVLKKARAVKNNELFYGVPFVSNIKPVHNNQASGVAPIGHKYSQVCDDNLYFSDNPAHLNYSNCSSLMSNAKANYKVRVQVCSPIDANLRPNYCEKYPSGDYKPVGAIQKNSDNTRFSMLSYLTVSPALTQILERNGVSPEAAGWQTEMYNKSWGGVLRAPGKFVGRNKYNTDLDFSDNNQKEWNEYTGQLILDANHQYIGDKMIAKNSSPLYAKSYPNTIKGNESTSEGTSIINYINEFGYYDRYKDMDSFSELIAETLRYLGGYNSPTYKEDFTDASTSRNPFNFYHKMDALPNNDRIEGIKIHTDTFPFLRNWDLDDDNKAVRSVCEKDNSHLITIADSNNWRSKILTEGSWRTTALTNNDSFFNGVSVKQLMDNINKDLNHFNSSNLSNNSQGDWKGMSTQNRYLSAALLAGANLYGINYQNSENIKINRVKSIIIDVGEPSFLAEDCHLYTAGIYGSNSLDEISDLISKKNISCAKWADARNNGSSSDIDNLLPSKGYFYPSSPNKIIENIQQAFNLPVVVNGNSSPGAIQDSGFTRIGNSISRKVFLFKNNLLSPNGLDTSISTQLEKFELYLEDGFVKERKNTQTLSWENSLKKSLSNNSKRNIILGGFLDSSGARDNPLNFTYKSIVDRQDYEAINALNIGLAQKEGSLNQTQLLMKRIDYIRGSSIDEDSFLDKKLFRKRNSLIGSTSSSNPYYQSKIDNKGLNILYIGGNDGMMHGINADTGEVVFSFLPRQLINKLYRYTEPNYVSEPILESQPIVKNIIPNSNSKVRKTILASGFGAGAKGIFALDVTKLHNSSKDKTFDEEDILLEFTDKDDADMGNFIGQPQFVSFKTGKNESNKDIVETMIAVTSGYNNGSKNQYLYLLKTNKPYKDKWTEGVNYIKMIVSSDFDNNGLSAPNAIGINGITRSIYMGDLQGNLWKIDFEDKKLSKVGAKAVFSASKEPTAMPITAKPALSYSKTGDVMISVGTGRYFGLNDLGKSQKTKQVLLTIRDDNPKKPYTLNDLDIRTIKDSEVSGLSTYKSKGWYLILPESQTKGERIVNKVLIQDSTVLFTSQILGDFNKSTCGTNEGARGSLNLEDGIGNYYSKPNQNGLEGNSKYYIGGLIILPTFDLNQYKTTGTSRTSVNRANNFIDVQAVFGQASDNEYKPQSGYLKGKGVAKIGVLSWREIQNAKIN